MDGPFASATHYLLCWRKCLKFLLDRTDYEQRKWKEKQQHNFEKYFQALNELKVFVSLVVKRKDYNRKKERTHKSVSTAEELYNVVSVSSGKIPIQVAIKMKAYRVIS